MLSDWKRAEGKAGTFKYTAGKWSADPDDKGNQVTFIILIKRKKWPLLCYVPKPIFLGMESYIIVAELTFFFFVHFNLANINNIDDTNSSGSSHSNAMKFANTTIGLLILILKLVSEIIYFHFKVFYGFIDVIMQDACDLVYV